MDISASSILSLFIWGNGMLLFLYLICQTTSVFRNTDCRSLIRMSEIAFLRFLLPVCGKFSIPFTAVNVLQTQKLSLFGYTFPLVWILLFCWLFVTLLLLIRMSVKYIQYRLAVNAFLNSGAAVPVSIPAGSVPKKIRVYESMAVSVPMLTGILHPVVLLPKIPLTWEETSLILNHELQHYRYKDIFTKICLELFLILYWWNPVMHMIKKKMLLLLEIRADLGVYETLNEVRKIEYLRCLQLLSGYRPIHPSCGIHFAEGKKSFLLQRVKYLIAENRRHTPPAVIMLFFSALLLCSFLFSFTAAPY